MIKNSIIILISVMIFSCTDEAKEVEKTEQITSIAPEKEMSIATDNSIEVFENNCTTCHGNDGTAGTLGAANLQICNLQNDSIIQIITNGNKTMPAFKEILSEAQIQQLSNYVKNLRK